MKNLIFLLFVVFVTSYCESSDPQEESLAGKTLAGKHYLKKVTEDKYYKITTDVDGSIKTTLFMVINDTINLFWTFPIERVRYEKIETEDQPHVRFRWMSADCDKITTLLSEKVVYVLVCLPEGMEFILEEREEEEQLEEEQVEEKEQEEDDDDYYDDDYY